MSAYTFNPPDHELINRYLNKKITEEDDLGTESDINEVNICHHEPAEIPALTKMQSSHTWHVISRVEKLKGRSQRTKRSSKTGHWKITGRSSMVKDVDGNIIGFKKFLVFKETKKKSFSSFSSSSSSSTGRQQNKSTWIIHEFHSSIQHPNKDAFVLCKLMKKASAPRSDSVAEASPVAEAPPAAADPIISPYVMQNNNISVDDFGGDFWDGVEDDFARFQSTDLLDQPHYNIEDLEIGEIWDDGRY